MSETAWYRMLTISITLHILVIAAFTIPVKFSSKKVDLSSSYSVNLVAGTGTLGGPQREAAQPVAKPLPEKPVAAKDRKMIAKSRPVPIQREKDLVSISNKKVPAREATTQQEMSELEKRLKEIRRKTDYIDVTKASGSGPVRTAMAGSAAGAGSDTHVNPLEQKYYLDVKDKIYAAWNMPSTAAGKSNLEMDVVIRIRKDGKLVDVSVDKGSGNRIYDESVMRAVRVAEPYPPIPAALDRDSIEIAFAFKPEMR